MRSKSLLTSASAIILLTGAQMTLSTTAETTSESETSAAHSAPPVAPRIPVEIEQVGRTRVDPYQWLKDPDWQTVMQKPETVREDIKNYLDAENAFTKTVLETPTTALQAELFEEMKGRIKEDDSSVPSIDGDYAYFRKFRTGGEYPIYVRKAASEAFDPDATETILLDGDALAEGTDYFDFAVVSHSPDHSKIAYTIDTKGSEFYTLKIRDTATGKDLDFEIPNTYGSFTWSADSNAIYWIERNENNRPEKLFYSVIGSSDAPKLVYHETDPGFFMGVGKSQSDKFIVIRTGGHTTSEYHVIPTDSEDPTELHTIAPRESDIEYSIADFDGQFYILTNADGAVDFKVMKAPHGATSRDDWEEVVPHRPGTLILGMYAFKDYLVRMERENGLPRIVVTPRGDGEEYTITFDEAAYDLDVYSGYEYDTTNMRFAYASPTTPDQTFDYDMATGDRLLRKTREVPSGHNASDYVAERVMVPGHDGEEIPVTILRHASTPVDGTAPLLLYGYGSYGITIPADFRTSRLSLVDRGFIYAIAHVRGSMAKGYQWYLDGKLEKKPNTFKDYISAGRYLVENGYGAEGRVVGLGGSAGGLLMGAASNMDPELFGGIIAAVPFVDVVNTMSDESLPLTPPEWPEWGNPLTDPEAYDTILAYSPYDQVTDRPYPSMLITGGLTDPRVTYWEPAKWAAKLRHEAPNAGPYFLRINMDAGHGGASGRFEGLKETALEYAFALATVGKVESVDLARSDMSDAE